MKYQELVGLVNEILGEYDQATVRQIYYRLVSPPYQYMPNTISAYTSFDRMLVRAREEGKIDWQKIVDHTRFEIGIDDPLYDNVEDFLEGFYHNVEHWWQRYDIDLWENQDYCLKVLVEKDALAQIMADVSLGYQVPVVVGRGYNSYSQLMQMASGLAEVDKSIIILYFGDFDPTGLDIDRSLEDRLSNYCDADFEVVRVALTDGDIVNLPPNPTKASDSRAASYIAQYGERCWELDALPPNELKSRVRQAIESYIDKEEWGASLQEREGGKEQIKKKIEKIKARGA